MALIGEVTVFLKTHSAAEPMAHAFTLHLVNEGRKRSKALADVANFEELKNSKFLTRDNMNRWLHELDSNYGYRPNWETISRQLKLPHAEDTKIEREWSNYLTDRKRRWNAATLEFATIVKTKVEPVIDATPNLESGLNAAVPVVQSIVRDWKPGASDHFVRAVILYEYKR